MQSRKIPFNRPYMTGKELWYIAQAHHNSMLSGDGPFTKHCERWLEKTIGCKRALLTHSCTAALEMAALLADIHPGDEVIMPSFTFVSTANAFVLRGAVPVFVDIRPDTLNMDETLIESAVTPKTKAIVVVHYAGVACAMEEIMSIASKHELLVIEDAAQSIFSEYRTRPLGSLGNLAAVSFHETKNITSGEGGALLINDERFIERALVIREKGTNRKQFSEGKTDKYTWVDMGSSYVPGEIIAAFLLAQMEEADLITEKRLHYWTTYHNAFREAEVLGFCRRPFIPDDCKHNAHMYYLLLPSPEARSMFIKELESQGINSVFHYVPLHSSPAGVKYGRTAGKLPHTDQVSSTLVRLPLYTDLQGDQAEVIRQANTLLKTVNLLECTGD